jgi:alkylated DNA repair dioxygenase AlkB
MLFEENIITIKNLLPYDGEVYYFGEIFDQTQSTIYFDTLLKTINWEHDVVKIFGKTITTSRKMAWYSIDNQAYGYSNDIKKANAFTPELLKIKEKVEYISGEKYNGCLLNLYQNGLEGMGWHADDEKEIETHSAIASISLGAQRWFHFKHKTTKETLKFHLENGSLLIMKGDTQKKWLHSLPKSTKIISPRINLTFRKLVKIGKSQQY